MADIRIKVAKDKAKLVKALRAGEGSTGPFQTYADVVNFAAAFGFSKKASVIVSATFGHLQYSSLELYTLKPCPI